MVGRSTRVTGPYVDKDGRELTRGGGSLVVDSNDEFVAIGHSAAYHFDGKDYFMAHGYSRSEDGASKLFFREMTWDEEGGHLFLRSEESVESIFLLFFRQIAVSLFLIKDLDCISFLVPL